MRSNKKGVTKLNRPKLVSSILSTQYALYARDLESPLEPCQALLPRGARFSPLSQHPEPNVINHRTADTTEPPLRSEYR
jgi:hypothetical protein